LLDLFGGEVLTAFETATKFRELHMVKTLAKGKTFKFPAIWRVGTSYHTPGTEITGKQIPSQDITVTPDAKLISDVFVTDIDEVLAHFDVRGPYANELGRALATAYDRNVARTLFRAARAGALFTGDTGGSVLTNATMGTSATTLFDSISAAKQTMDEKDVPIEQVPLYAAFRAAQWYLMARSDRNLNRDFNGGDASLRSQNLRTVDDIQIVKSNLLPAGTNSTSDTTIPLKYRIDMTKSVGVVWTPQAIATAEVQGLSTQVIDQPSKQGTLMIGRLMVGTDPVRSKCAVELATP
jgi:hypothetical protein